jgi:broad specificity phosphatase PhoE
MNLYVFRHGETFATKNQIEYGDKIVDAPIIPEGIKITKKIANYLTDIETDFFAISEFLRVVQTAEIIAEITGKKFTTDKRLNEAMIPPPGLTYPYTETWKELEARISSFLDEVEQSYNTVLIGTHGGIIAGIKHLLIKNKFDPEDIRDYPPPGVLTIIKNNKIEEVDFN